MKLYETIIGTAVDGKRLIKGLGEQAAFTRYLESIEYKSRDELYAMQAEEMSVFLNHAVNNVPFYQKFKNGLELTPKTVHKDIKEFPVLTKEIIEDNMNELVTMKGTAGKRYKSGGTSGKTAYIIRDKNEVIHSADEYFNKMGGVVPGKSRLLIRRAESVYNAKDPHDKIYTGNFLTRTFIVSPAFMDNKRLELLYSLYSRKKPKLIMGITDPIYRFAQYILDSGLQRHPVEAILLGGQTMLPKYRKTIEKAFGTKVLFDRYGATEFGILAHQCNHFNGLHYIPVIHYVEVLNDDLSDAEMGKAGQFIVTNLRKREMPLIRYQIDDIAAMTDKTCSCGRGLPMIETFEGWRIEAVVSPMHTYMTPLPFFEIMSEYSNVEDFIVEQRKENTIYLMLKMKSGKFSQVQQLSFRKKVNRYLDYPMKVEFEYIDEIKPLPNGKIMRIKGYENFKNK